MPNQINIVFQLLRTLFLDCKYLIVSRLYTFFVLFLTLFLTLINHKKIGRFSEKTPDLPNFSRYYATVTSILFCFCCHSRTVQPANLLFIHSK